MAASDFIAKYGSAADAVSKETGIPAERILGQAGLETGWNSAPPGNNFFGIKGPGFNLATHEADASGALVPTTQSFRAYADPTDSFRDWAKLIQTGYKGALDPNLDDAGYAKAIKAGGYATDPNYAAKLHGSIQTARQHHDGGWETVGDASPVGAGAGFGDGRDDKGWETVATAAPVSAAPADTNTPAPPQADAAAQAADSKEAQATPLSADPSSGIADPLSSMAGAAPGQAAAGRVFQRDALSNLQGLWDTAKQVVTDPVGSAKAVGSAIGAGAKKVVTDPAGAATDVKNFAVDQFANPAKPATAMLNIGSILMPGGAGRGALATGTGAVRGADAVLAPTLGRVLTGVPGDLQREASRAGEAGGAQGAAFRGQFKGTAPGDVTVDLAKGAAKEIQDASYAEKKAGESQWAGKSVDAGAPADVQTALADARKSNRDVAGIVQSPETEATLNALQGHLDTAFPGGQPLNGQSLSVDAFDALKRRMGDTLSTDGGSFDTGPGSRVYHATRQALIDAYPDYAAQMEKSQNAIESAKQMRKQLSLGSTNDATVAGALQRAARNDASGAYGMRKDQLMKLVQQKPELLSAISGQAMNAAHPRGITPMLALSIPGHVALGPMGAVTGLLQYALGIPKLHGAARYALGALTRRTSQVGLSQANIGRILDIARIVGTQSKPNQDTP